MILFVFEGYKREPDLFYSIQRLFFDKTNEHIVCSFGNNLYQLYKELKKYEDNGDLVSILREKYEKSQDNPFKSRLSSDFSEIYMFFDYDFQNVNLPLEVMNSQLKEMLDTFNDETNNGKLYINYPMVESIRYTNKLPDSCFHTYTVSREQCRKFKLIADKFSYYKSLDFIILDKRKADDDNKTKVVLDNWNIVRKQNVDKANYICTGTNGSPKTKEIVSQGNIFKNQLSKYVSQFPCRISILNAFPMFLYEYFK